MAIRTIRLPPRTPEQEELIRRHRMHQELRLAKEGLEWARENYSRLLSLYFESLRKEESDVN